uniref:Methyltransferase n=1 Tax=viral metagenome TaxID=1070528 RepID=A0A6C0D889_9ZZZZ
MSDLEGITNRQAENWWVGIIPYSNDRPIIYGEIGVFCGHNLISVEQAFANHPESKLYAMDPWADYDGYPENIGKQELHYSYFCNNIKKRNIQHKVVILRNKSQESLLTIEDNFFDILYIDGSHEYEYVVKDCELSILKTKVGGYIIIDDTNYPPVINAVDEVLGKASNIRLVKDSVDQRTYQKIN